MDGRCDGLWYVLLTDVVGPRLDRIAPTVWMECWRAARIRYPRLQLQPHYADHAHANLTRTCMPRQAERSAARNKKWSLLWSDHGCLHSYVAPEAHRRCPPQRHLECRAPTRRALDYLVFRPSIAERPTLPSLHLFLRYTVSGVVRGTIVIIGRRDEVCQRIAITAAPLPATRTYTRTRRNDYQERDTHIPSANAW